MKINQLFVKHVDLDMLQLVVQCFGLSGLEDRRLFTKTDMQAARTVERISALLDQLREYYLPCKAKIYLTSLSEKKVITVLKQILKLHAHILQSRERNSRHHKVILYQIISEREFQAGRHIEVRHDLRRVEFT